MICVAIANLAATIINANALNKVNRDLMRERRYDIVIGNGESINPENIARQQKRVRKWRKTGD